jgi:hypothetical protein
MGGVPAVYTHYVCAAPAESDPNDTGNDAAVGISPIGDLRIHAEDPEKEL